MKTMLRGGGGIIALGALLVSFGANAGEMLKSGYAFSTPETRAMQDDDFDNPAFLWVDVGEAKWSAVDGSAGKSCADCHQDAADTMKGVGANYPKYDEKLGKPVTLSQKINMERTERMGAEKWKWESDEMLGMTAYVMKQSRGMKFNVKIDGAMKPFFDKGEDMYNRRRGLLDLACKHCHVDYPDTMIRANKLSNGLANGFPTYRLKWQKMGSLHRRFKGCNSQVRAEPYESQSDEYVNLELFLKWRSMDAPVEAPSVRM